LLSEVNAASDCVSEFPMPLILLSVVSIDMLMMRLLTVEMTPGLAAGVTRVALKASLLGTLPACVGHIALPASRPTLVNRCVCSTLLLNLRPANRTTFP